MAGKSRRERYAEQTRADVIAAAIECFASAGYAATSVDDVAEQAGVAKGGVYHHFATKAELFEAAFIALEERLQLKVSERLDTLSDPDQLMPAGIDLFLEECTHRDFRRIVLEEAPAALGWSRWKSIDERFFLGILTEGLGILASTGAYEFDAPELVAKMLLAALSEAALIVAASPKPKVARENAKNALLHLIKGFRVD